MQRVRGPEPQPIVLPQRRVYVLPTAAGLGVCVMLAVMLLAAINYNLSLGYAATFLIAGTGIAHILASWRTLVGLSISLQAEGESFARGNGHFRLSLGGTAKQSRHAIRVLDEFGDLLADVDTVVEGESQHLALKAPQRGRMFVGRLTIETRYPLGWVRAWSYVEPDASTIVFPAPVGDLPVPAAYVSASQGGQTRPALHSEQEEFAGLREWRPGDSPGRIAWRRVARDGGLLVKQYEAPLQSEDCVFDWASLPGNLTLEQRLSQMTVWLLQARVTHTRCALILPDARLGPDDSATHYRDCLERLALYGVRHD